MKLRKREDRRAEAAGIRTEEVDSFRHIFATEVIDATIETIEIIALAEVVGAEAAVEMTIGRRVEAIDTNLEEEEDLEIATIGRRVEVTIGGAAIDEEMIAHRVVDLATEGMTEGTIEGRRHRAMTVSRDGNPVKLHLNNILIKRFTQHYTKNMTTLSKSDYLYTALNYVRTTR